MLLDHIAVLDRRITKLDRKIRDRARTDDTARRLMSIPGVGPISAVALEALERRPAQPRDRPVVGLEAIMRYLTCRCSSSGGIWSLCFSSAMAWP